MAEINLLKSISEERKPFSLGGSRSRALYIMAAILILEILIYGGFIFYERYLAKKILAAEKKAAELNFEIGKMDHQRSEAISFQSRLLNLEALLDNHVFWSALFKELEDFTYKFAIYNSLQINEGENKILLAGNISSYTDLSKLILGLKKSSKVLDVVLQSSGQEEGEKSGYSFTLEVTFDPRLLLK